MQLTGPPRLAGIVRGYASAGGPIQDAWEDRSTYLQGRRRTRLKGRRQLWPSWSFQLVVTASEWLAWRSDLEGDEAGEFDWSPRTRMPGDSDLLAEHVYRARCASSLPTLSELRRRDVATGAHVYVVDVEVEGVEPYPVRPDAVTGGFARLNAASAVADGYHELEPYGSATLVETAYPVSITDPATGQFVQGTRYYADLGDDRIVAFRSTTEPDGTLTFQTRD